MGWRILPGDREERISYGLGKAFLWLADLRSSLLAIGSESDPLSLRDRLHASRRDGLLCALHCQHLSESCFHYCVADCTQLCIQADESEPVLLF